MESNFALCKHVAQADANCSGRKRASLCARVASISVTKPSCAKLSKSRHAFSLMLDEAMHHS